MRQIDAKSFQASRKVQMIIKKNLQQHVKHHTLTFSSVSIAVMISFTC